MAGEIAPKLPTANFPNIRTLPNLTLPLSQTTGVLSVANGGTGVTTLNPVIQQVRTKTGSVSTGTTTIPFDNTIPQNTEGDQYMTLAITPTNTNSVLKIDVVYVGAQSVASDLIQVALFQDSTANALTATALEMPFATVLSTLSFSYYMTAGTTSSTTFKIRAGGTAGTHTFNGVAGAGKYGGVISSSIIITEYAS